MVLMIFGASLKKKNIEMIMMPKWKKIRIMRVAMFLISSLSLVAVFVANSPALFVRSN